MNMPAMQRSTTDFCQLTLPDPLLLLEQLVRHVRQETVTVPGYPALESQLAAMANDPDMQRELQKIEVEFASTEADGLGMPA